MANILIINGGKVFGHSEGALNKALTQIAEDLLKSHGLNVKVTVPDNAYDVEEEVNKYLWADVIIYQMPAWWMGIPWTVKKYIDEVFTHGRGDRIYTNDGRTRTDPTKKYGSGGLLHGKKFMLSVTWNAPTSAFDDKDDFFEGMGVDGVYFAFHKSQEFVGMTSLKTFMCNDVIKQPNIENDFIRYKTHLESVVVKHCQTIS